MKSLLTLTLIVLLFLKFEITKAQTVKVTSWTFNKNVRGFFINDNDQIVLSALQGIYLYDDSLEIQQISSEQKPSFKGRNGNVLFSDGRFGITSWTPTGSFFYPGDSSTGIFSEFATAIAQLPDGNIIANVDDGPGVGYSKFDSTGVSLVFAQPGSTLQGTPILEINANEFVFSLSGFGQVDTFAYYNPNTGNINKVSSTTLVGLPIIGFDYGPGENLLMHYQDGILEVNKDSIINIAYFASLPVSVTPYYAQAGYCSVRDEKYVVADPNTLVIYDNGNLYQYDSIDGYDVNTTNLGLFADANSQGILYFMQSNTMHKIEVPILTGISNKDIDNNFKIYPNPTKHQINFSSSNLNGNVDLVLKDLQGQVILNKSNISLKQPLQIPTNCNAGIYMISIQMQDNNVTKKIIIDRK